MTSSLSPLLWRLRRIRFDGVTHNCKCAMQVQHSGCNTIPGQMPLAMAQDTSRLLLQSQAKSAAMRPACGQCLSRRCPHSVAHTGHRPGRRWAPIQGRRIPYTKGGPSRCRQLETGPGMRTQNASFNRSRAGTRRHSRSCSGTRSKASKPIAIHVFVGCCRQDLAMQSWIDTDSHRCIHDHRMVLVHLLVSLPTT